ncbi:MAG: glycosyl transferase [Xanthobacteraceae bacterium]|nr:MAG: glycosyl transferase [Xanthobacteraceae bacterium]
MAGIIPLTFIIPCFGRQQKLERAISSIFAQVLWPEEIVIVDDASPEPLTLPPAAAETGRVRLVRLDANGGAAAARDKGLQVSRTEWVSFLDSDDFLLPNTVHQRWQCVQAEEERSSKKGYTIYGCCWKELAHDGSVLRMRYPSPASDSPDFFQGCWFSPGSCVILNRSEVLRTVGGLDRRLRRLEDYEWFIRLGLAGFELKIQQVEGVCIERGYNTTFATITEATALVRLRIWQLTRNRSDRLRLRCRAEAYLRYEQAASAWRERRIFTFIILLTISMLVRPRLNISPLPIANRYSEFGLLPVSW